MKSSSTNKPDEKKPEVLFKYLQNCLEIIKNNDQEEYDFIQEKLNEAISAWEKALASFLSINIPNIYELRMPSKEPSEEVLGVLCACMYLMGNHTSEHHIKMNKGLPAEVNWKGCTTMLNGWHRLKGDMERMGLAIEDDDISLKSRKEIRKYLEKPWFNVEELKEKSEGAAKFADFVINVVKSADIFWELRPRIEMGIRKAEMKSQEKDD